MASKNLRSQKIIQILSEDSEDDLDYDGDSIVDPEFLPQLDDLFSSDDAQNSEDISDEDFENYISDPQPSTSSSKKAKINVLWKKKNLTLNEQQLNFTGNTTLPSDILDCDTPIQFFLYLFPKDIFLMIAKETNAYITQKDPNNMFRVSEIDIQQFIGVVYIMSLIKLPRVTNHWNNYIGTPLIQEVMPVQKFEKIRQHIHFNDNTKDLPQADPNVDRIYKIRPLVDKLNERFLQVPLEKYLCIDEQICSTKARNILKRYNPKKPHKWGYKIFVLSGVSGFAHNIEVETGKENIVQPGEPDFGASSNVIIRLARSIPKHQNYRLYFDNYFTSLPLLEYLAKEGIFSLGTIRRNRIPECKLPAEKDVLRKDRGYSVEYVANINGIDISTVSWKDNKIVNLASTFVGEMPKSQVKRYDKKNKKYVTIDRPSIVGEYNRHMGGVDLIDSIMARYKILLRSKRWQVRLFYHLLDLTMANSWLLYRRVRKEKHAKDKELSSADFRLEVAKTLCKLEVKPNILKRSSIESRLQVKKHKGSAQHVPPIAVRQDQVGHWPIWVDKRIRCKFPKCTGVTQTMCDKCSVALCYNKNNNCFRLFHIT